jgi:hypothetical protein
VQYFGKNFGPDQAAARVASDKEMPLDEAKLGKAEYIEYYLTPDPPRAGHPRTGVQQAHGRLHRQTRPVRTSASIRTATSG